MGKFKLYIEYEGTRYSGWQVQNNVKTIQGILLSIAYDIFKTKDIELQGSGRTDAGVHALCQVAHLSVKTMLAPEIIKMKFNDALPNDINILEVEKTNDKFHARHSAESRTYIYVVSKRRTAFNKNFVWWIKDKLDVRKMDEAAKFFTGMNDFKSFADKDDTEKSTKVLIEKIEVEELPNVILIKITGSHFLWKMVRRIVGVLVNTGRGKISLQDVKSYLTKYSNEPAKFTAPPSGLFLENISYKDDPNKVTGTLNLLNL